MRFKTMKVKYPTSMTKYCAQPAQSACWNRHAVRDVNARRGIVSCLAYKRNRGWTGYISSPTDVKIETLTGTALLFDFTPRTLVHRKSSQTA